MSANPSRTSGREDFESTRRSGSNMERTGGSFFPVGDDGAIRLVDVASETGAADALASGVLPTTIDWLRSPSASAVEPEGAVRVPLFTYDERLTTDWLAIVVAPQLVMFALRRDSIETDGGVWAAIRT